MQFCKLICEWDIGQEDLIFVNTEVALQWAIIHLKEAGIDDDFQELIEEGLISVEQITLLNGEEDCFYEDAEEDDEQES